MKNRREFLIQGTLATTAMFAVKPLKSIGSVISKVTGYNDSCGKFAFIHTANLNRNDHKAIRYIHDLKNTNRNTILLNAGHSKHNEPGSLIYDASFNATNDLNATEGNYKIITKSNTRIGIITAKSGEENIIQKVTTLSSWLKDEKNCTVVVCLSQLGYRNKRSPDDIKLARASAHLDIIIGGHKKNFHEHPVVALNSNNAEVIIHSSSGNSFAFGKIEFHFDELGKKNYVSFADNRPKNNISKKAKAAV